jgi:hypothetical protein
MLIAWRAWAPQRHATARWRPSAPGARGARGAPGAPGARPLVRGLRPRAPKTPGALVRGLRPRAPISFGRHLAVAGAHGVVLRQYTQVANLMSHIHTRVVVVPY